MINLVNKVRMGSVTGSMTTSSLYFHVECCESTPLLVMDGFQFSSKMSVVVVDGEMIYSFEIMILNSEIYNSQSCY